MIVRDNHITQRRQPLLNPLDAHGVRERVAQVLEFLIRGACGDEQAVAVPGRETPDYARPGDGAVADWDEVGQLGFEG